MAENPISRIKQLDQERAKLISKGKKEALERAKVAIADLNALGFSYSLTERLKLEKHLARKGTGLVGGAPCPICEYKTTPVHDGRKHRGQGKHKRPFTSEELIELGLEKV